MNMSFWLAVIGLVMNLAGTILLIFSLPATMRFDSTKHLEIRIPDETTSEFQYAINLFQDRVMKEKNRSVLLALFLLIFGALFQIIALQPDLIIEPFKSILRP
jgi:hypothetical protein